MIINQNSISNYYVVNSGVITNTNGVFAIAGNGVRSGLFQPHSLSSLSETIIEVSFLARMTAGSVGGRAVASSASSHDLASATITERDSFPINSNEWKKYTFKVVYGLNTTDVLALIGFEVANGVTSTIQVKDIMMNLVHGVSQNKPEMVACGMVIKASGGSPTLNVDFPQFNVDGVTFNGTDELTVTINVTSTLRKRPLIQAVSTPDYGYPALVGSIVAGNQTTFKIKFPNNGSFMNIASQAVYIMFTVWL